MKQWSPPDGCADRERDATDDVEVVDDSEEDDEEDVEDDSELAVRGRRSARCRNDDAITWLGA